MAKDAQRSYIGEGTVYIGSYGGGPLRSVGQVKEFKVDVSEDVKELKNYQGGGGLASSASMISKVEATLNFASISASNLAIALRGENEDIASAAIASTAVTGSAGALIFLSGIDPTEVSIAFDSTVWQPSTAYTVGVLVTATNPANVYRCKTAGTTGAANSEPDWVSLDPAIGADVGDEGSLVWENLGPVAIADTEWEVKSAGIFIPETVTRLSTHVIPFMIGYTKTAGSLVEGLVGSSLQYRIVLAGTNFADEGSGNVIDLYKCTFSPTKDLSLIGEDFASLTLTASVLQDMTKSGTGISQFCSITMADE